MKHLLITTIAAVVLVGCGPSVDIHQAAWTGDIEAVKQNLADGADVNAKDEGGWTPLRNAVKYGHKEIVELLIAEGADVNAKNEDGWTPLHWAALEGHNEIVELLIAEGADVNAKNKDGETAQDLTWDVNDPFSTAASRKENKRAHRRKYFEQYGMSPERYAQLQAAKAASAESRRELAAAQSHKKQNLRSSLRSAVDNMNPDALEGKTANDIRQAFGEPRSHQVIFNDMVWTYRMSVEPIATYREGRTGGGMKVQRNLYQTKTLFVHFNRATGRVKRANVVTKWK